MKYIKHPNILRYIDKLEDPDYYYIITEDPGEGYHVISDMQFKTSKFISGQIFPEPLAL